MSERSARTSMWGDMAKAFIPGVQKIADKRRNKWLEEQKGLQQSSAQFSQNALEKGYGEDKAVGAWGASLQQKEQAAAKMQADRALGDTFAFAAKSNPDAPGAEWNTAMARAYYTGANNSSGFESAAGKDGAWAHGAKHNADVSLDANKAVTGAWQYSEKTNDDMRAKTQEQVTGAFAKGIEKRAENQNMGLTDAKGNPVPMSGVSLLNTVNGNGGVDWSKKDASRSVHSSYNYSNGGNGGGSGRGEKSGQSYKRRSCRR
jgi:hypothetical protein